MTFLDTVLVFGVLFLIVLLVWSRVMQQTMLQTVVEIKEILKGAFAGTDE